MVDNFGDLTVELGAGIKYGQFVVYFLCAPGVELKFEVYKVLSLFSVSTSGCLTDAPLSGGDEICWYRHVVPEVVNQQPGGVLDATVLVGCCLRGHILHNVEDVAGFVLLDELFCFIWSNAKR